MKTIRRNESFRGQDRAWAAERQHEPSARELGRGTVLVLADVINMAEIVALSLFIGLVNAVDVPVRQSFIVEMVPIGDDLANAIALDSSNFNLARLMGPSIAGVLIGLAGEGIAFLLNAASYLAVIAALLAIRVPPRPPRTQVPPVVWTHLMEGIGYVARFSPIRSVLLLLALVSTLAAPYVVLMPVFARDVLHGDAHTDSRVASDISLAPWDQSRKTCCWWACTSSPLS